MGRINLLQSGMAGVDLKSNPLLIGEKKKLRFATNMVFEEGVLRSRYGVRYENLCCSGQFQGAVDFQPTRGLSYQPHSSADAGIALVVKGSLYLNGEKLSGNIFKSRGPVNLYQAENYLIIQNVESETYWWDGETLTKSQGMSEVDFAEIETPVFEMQIVPPVADITPCIDDEPETCTEESSKVIVHICNSSVQNPLADAMFTLMLNGNFLLTKTTGANGKISFNVPQDLYTYTVAAEGYDDFLEAVLDVNGCITEYVILKPKFCSVVITQAGYSVSSPESGIIIITNTGSENVTITDTILAGTVTLTIPPLPITLSSGDTVTIIVESSVSLAGTSLSVVTSCGTYNKEWEEIMGGYCARSIETSRGEGIGLWINNTGTLPLEVTGMSLAGGLDFSGYVIFGGISVSLPYVVEPGTYLLATWGFPSNGVVYGYTIVSSCSGNTTTDTGTI